MADTTDQQHALECAIDSIDSALSDITIVKDPEIRTLVEKSERALSNAKNCLCDALDVLVERD